MYFLVMKGLRVYDEKLRVWDLWFSKGGFMQSDGR